MKTSIKSFVSLCSIGLLTSGLAFAEPAVVIDGNNCALFKEDGGFTGGVGKKVTTNSSNNNISLTCFQDMEPTLSGRSVIFNFDNTGLRCVVSGHPTDDWHQVISRSGNAKLTCHYHE